MRGIRSKRLRTVKKDTLMVTVDVGMTSNMGYCTTADGRDIKPFKFSNTRVGLNKFWSIVVANKKRFRCNEVIVGYESTGPLCRAFCSFSEEQARNDRPGQPHAHETGEGDKQQFTPQDRRERSPGDRRYTTVRAYENHG